MKTTTIATSPAMRAFNYQVEFVDCILVNGHGFEAQTPRQMVRALIALGYVASAELLKTRAEAVGYTFSPASGQ